MYRLTAVVMIVALMLIGCSQDVTQTTAPTDSRQLSPLATSFTADNIISATLHLNVILASNRTINLHRATAAWDEATVTYGTFGESYDPTVEDSFLADGTGWRTADVTNLVMAYLDGTYDNFGFLLKTADFTFPRTIFNSSEAYSNHPILEICYGDPINPQCIQIGADHDSFIWENYPTGNFGDYEVITTGWENDVYPQKHALIHFPLPTPPEPAAIGDYVWYDDNENGIQDEGEIGIEGVQVNLYDCQDMLIGSMMTDANGYYLFDELTPGDYYVEFETPLGFVFTAQDQGMDDAVDSDVDPMTGRTICTTLDPGETDLTWDAGMHMPPPQVGCTLTIGYWKNHAGFGPQDDNLSQFLPIWLGVADGEKSMLVDDVQIAYDILVRKTYGHSSNGITKLYAQLLATKLNIANGAADDDIAGVIADADAFLAEYDWNDWKSLKKRTKKSVLSWMSDSDDYNNGIIGPGHCDIFGDGDDD